MLCYTQGYWVAAEGIETLYFEGPYKCTLLGTLKIRQNVKRHVYFQPKNVQQETLKIPLKCAKTRMFYKNSQNSHKMYQKKKCIFEGPHKCTLIGTLKITPKCEKTRMFYKNSQNSLKIYKKMCIFEGPHKCTLIGTLKVR